MQPKIRAGLPVTILKVTDTCIIGYYVTPDWVDPIPMCWFKDGSLINKDNPTNIDLVYEEEKE